MILWGEDGFSFWISEEGVFIDALIVIAAIILFDTFMPKKPHKHSAALGHEDGRPCEIRYGGV